MEAETKEKMKLPILPIKPNTHSNSLSSPIHSSISASVPFSWEEEPGKPKPKPSLSSSTSSSTLTSSSSPETPKSLELPPRLLQLQSPITVFDGPFSATRSRRLDSPSLRMMVKGTSECYGSFRSDIYVDEEEEDKNSLAIVKKRGRLGFFGFRRRKALKKGKSEFGRGSYVFPSENREEEEEGEYGISCSQSSRFCEVKINNITRTGSFSALPASTTPSSSSKSHFWTNVYAGLKQVVPWKNKKTPS